MVTSLTYAGTEYLILVLSSSSISVSGLAAQGHPCTATICWFTVRPHLLYSASSSAPLTKYSVLRKGISIVPWLHKNVHPSDEIWSQIKTSQFFSCRFLVVHISPTRTEELVSHHQQSPIWWKTYKRRGAARCPEGIVATLPSPVPCSLRHDVSHLALFVVLGCYPHRRGGRQGLGFGGVPLFEQTALQFTGVLFTSCRQSFA
jgi:hypothetical protein